MMCSRLVITIMIEVLRTYHSHAWNAGNGLNVEIIIGRCEPHSASILATGGLFDAQEINYAVEGPRYTVVGSSTCNLIRKNQFQFIMMLTMDITHTLS